jgi:BlaI family penicillinase repressor
MPPVSDAELEVLKVLWAYTTVLTLLTRLREKGYVEADRRDTAHVFRAVVTRDELVGSSLSALADRVCDGTASPLLLALVRDPRLSTTDIAHLRKLLNELQPED